MKVNGISRQMAQRHHRLFHFKIRKDNTMKDDEVEGLFAYGWLDLLLAVAILCAIAAAGFFVGYLL